MTQLTFLFVLDVAVPRLNGLIKTVNCNNNPSKTCIHQNGIDNNNSSDTSAEESEFGNFEECRDNVLQNLEDEFVDLEVKLEESDNISDSCVNFASSIPKTLPDDDFADFSTAAPQNLPGSSTVEESGDDFGDFADFESSAPPKANHASDNLEGLCHKFDNTKVKIEN